MKGRHPLRIDLEPPRRAVQLQTEPRAGASRGHVHADEDVGDEVARGGDDVRRRRGWAGPLHPIQQGGNLFLRDARDDDSERPRGTCGEGARLEHVAAFRQRYEDALDRSEHLFVATPADGGGKRREQARRVPVLGTPGPRSGGGGLRREEDAGSRRRPARRRSGQIVLQHHRGHGTGEVRIRIRGLFPKPGREGGGRRSRFGMSALGNVVTRQVRPREGDYAKVGVRGRLREMEFEAEMGVEHRTGQPLRPVQQTFPAAGVEKFRREQGAASFEDRGEGAVCASRPLSRLTARTSGLHAAEAFRSPSLFRHIPLPPPLPGKTTGVARDEAPGVNAAPRSVPAAREAGACRFPGRSRQPSLPGRLLRSTRCGGCATTPPSPAQVRRDLRPSKVAHRLDCPQPVLTPSQMLAPPAASASSASSRPAGGGSTR